jgi:hypothetical protein
VFFLQLGEEFGGARFGPFSTSPIRLGSDPQQNEITLPEALGVSPQHLQLIPQNPGYLLSPSSKTAAVYLFSGGRVKEIAAPTPIAEGDSFALATEQGPRFTLQEEIGRMPAAGQAPAPARGLLAEIRRRGLAKVLTTKLGNQLQSAWTFMRTGQFMSPIYVVGAMTMVAGTLYAGGTTCALYQVAQDRDRLASEAGNEGPGISRSNGSGDPTTGQLVASILGQPAWETAISDDTTFRQHLAMSLRRIYAQPEEYAWALETDHTSVAKLHAALLSQRVDPATTRVLAYTAAHPSLGGLDLDFRFETDSRGQEVCARGPLALTYRQATQLGLLDVSVDANVSRVVADSNNLPKLRTRLEQTANEANREVTPANQQLAFAGFQGARECVFVDQNDERNDIDQLAATLSRAFIRREAQMPTVNQTNGVASRVLTVFASDLTDGFDGLRTDERSLSVQLELVVGLDDGERAFLLGRTADTVARAVAIPCLSAMKNRPTPEWAPGPSLASCAVLQAYVDNDRI